MAIGSTLRPELGRMDFSGIERGGRAAAEAIMRGSERLGAGIQSAGSSIGGAIKERGEMKSEITAAQKWIDVSKDMPGVSQEAIDRLDQMGQMLKNEEVPLSQRAALASDFRRVGQTISLTGMERLMGPTPEQLNDPNRFQSVEKSGMTIIFDTLTDKVVAQGKTGDNPPQVSLNERTAAALGQLGVPAVNVTQEQLKTISETDPAVAGQIAQLGESQRSRQKEVKEERSAGMEEFSKKTAVSVQEWTAGGQARASTNINVLQEIQQGLISGEIMTGGIVDKLPPIAELPSFIRKFTQEGQETQNALLQVQGVVFQSLRDTLGAQFTEREGERLVNVSFDPALSPEQNIELLQRSINLNQSIFMSKNAEAKYFLDNRGSMEGFDYENLTGSILQKELNALEQYKNSLRKQQGLPETPASKPTVRGITIERIGN